MIRDASLFSPARLWCALRLWSWLRANDCHVPLARLLRYYRRPYAAHLRDAY